MKWKIGEVEIFQIVEVECGALIQSIIPEATPENIKNIKWLFPHFSDEAGNLKAQVAAYLVKSAGKNILIDPCNGNDKTRTDLPEWSNLRTDFLKKLEENGVTAQTIDIVACTHFHSDHVGWNTRLENGVWVPTFPNAKYLFVKKEYEYWQEKPEKELADDKAAFDDSVKPIIDADLHELVESDYQIDKNIRLMPTPGHTPDHVSVLINSDGQLAIISGDFLHHPCQIAHPDWSIEGDTFPKKALETRQKVLTEIADANTLLIGSHFAAPTAGHVKRFYSSFIFEV